MFQTKIFYSLHQKLQRRIHQFKLCCIKKWNRKKCKHTWSKHIPKKSIRSKVSLFLKKTGTSLSQKLMKSWTTISKTLLSMFSSKRFSSIKGTKVSSRSRHIEMTFWRMRTKAQESILSYSISIIRLMKILRIYTTLIKSRQGRTIIHQLSFWTKLIFLHLSLKAKFLQKPSHLSKKEETPLPTQLSHLINLNNTSSIRIKILKKDDKRIRLR